MTLLSTTPALVTVPGTGGNTYTATFKTFTNIASPGTTSDLVTLTVYYVDNANNKTVQVQKTDYITKNPQAESIQIELQGKTAPTGSSITIVSTVPYTQVYSFPPGSPVDPATIELALDRVTMMAKQNNDRLNNAVGLDNPPSNAAIRLIVPEPIVTENPVFWEQDPDNASRFYLRSADFTIQDFQQLHDETVTARDQAVAAASAASGSAQAAANSAIASANSAASSAQTYASIQVYGTQLRSDMETIKDVTEEFRDQAEASALAAANSAQEAAASEQEVVQLLARIPTPVGQPINRTYVTNGSGSLVFQPYYPIENINTATAGQVLAVQDGPNGKSLIASSPVTTSDKVSTYLPIDEGGATVSAALLSHQRRLDFLDNTAEIYPYGKQHVIADFIVNADGNLRSGVDFTVVPRLDAVNIQYQQFGNRTAYWTSGNNFTLPAAINGKPLILNTHSMMFGIYVDANTPDTVIFSNTAFVIKKVANNIQFIHDTVTVNLPLTVNQWAFYCLTLSGASFNPNLGGYTARFNAGAIAVTDLTPTSLVSAIPNNQDISVNMENNLRLVRLAFIDQVVTKDQFQTWVSAIYGLAVGEAGVPDPTTGQNGQAVVIESGAYALRTPLLLDPIATGYNVDNSMEISAATATGEYVLAMDINTTTKAASFKPVQLNFDIVTNVPAGWTIVDKVNATTDLAATGLYNWYFDVNATAKTITLKVSKMNPPTTLKTTIFTAAPTPATPQQLIGDNNNAVNRFIQNETGYDIVVGTQAELAANDDQGITIRSGSEYSSKANRAMFVRFPVGATALPADAAVKIIEEVLV